MSAITEKTADTITMRFEVKDSGIGMTQEQIERVFRPFEQGDDSTKRKYGGTGLGLTITKNFIEIMGGELMVESTIGLGSRFSFEIKFDTMEIDEETSPSFASAQLTEKPVFKGDILVCEDNLLNQQVISDHLSRIGLHAVIASNGRKGVDIVKERITKNEKPFDLILMDIHMPEMDGLEAAKKIMEAGCNTPIVALTANIMANDRETYLSSGMTDCLSKPFVAKELWTCIYKYIKPVSMVKKSELDNVEDEEQRIGIISTFIKSHKNSFCEILDALEDGDLQLAHRLAHTLKGVAALVGMPMLSEAAMVIEQTIVSGKMDYIDEKMSTLKYELNFAMNELMPVIDEYKSKIRKESAGVPMDKKESLELFDRLEKLLQANSFESINLLNDLAAISETEMLMEQIENFNFKQALEILAQIRKQTENQ
jgi:CheY-like chemotaxis protein